MTLKYSLTLLLAICATQFTFAQKNFEHVAQQINAQNGTPAFLKFKENQNFSASKTQEVLRTHLDMKQQDDFTIQKSETDKIGFQHDKYQQYFDGIRVEYGTYTVHAKAGRIDMMSGEFKKIDNNLNTTPSLSEAGALSAALSHVGAKQYMWQSMTNESWVKNEQKDNTATFYPEGELVIIEDYSNKADKANYRTPVLAYKFDIYAEQPISRDYVYVNAQTGKVVHTNPIIKHAAASGTFATKYSGTKTLTADSYNGSFRLRDYSRGSGIATYDMNEGTNYGSAVDFIDNNNDWTSAEWNNAAEDNAAFDAHYGAQATYDYFLAKFNRNSYNNNGATINSYVHYSANYDNAFWDGQRMTYGDGATSFSPLTSMDVAAHEIGHAVCTYTANLVYSYESGAMNEGFSDIWGACVEYDAEPGKQTWLIGEDISLQSAALRSMSNPNSQGQPDTYQGTSWYSGSGDNGGVHYNSGVLNHWFYLLSVGGSGTNDNGTAFSVIGIGIDEAAQIAYRAESVYLSSNSQYSDARTYAIQSATDLYGACSQQVISTTSAWQAVGIGAGSDCGTSCDDGVQNGNETGVDCGGTSCPACPCNGTNVTVSITFDNYPEETSWSIVDAGGATVASGGTYASQPDGSTVTETLCLADACYDFVINDAYGDGICCSYGNGSYSVTDENGNALASGASFASSETTNFCVSGTPPTPTCDDGVQNGDETGVDCGGSCAACPVPGCTDASAHNYDSNATTDDGSCETCSDGVQNGDETAVDCGGALCATCPVPGCTDASAHNYDSNATTDDGSCETCSDGAQNGDETDVDCGGSLCAPCGGGACTYQTINSNNFNSNWGIWNDGGSDCRRSSNDAAYASGGTGRPVRLRDNTSTSTATTDNINLASYEELTVDFTYIARSMENGEDFWLQISTDGGASYSTEASWARGSDFQNEVRENESVVISGPFSTNTRLRFRCDASGNSDWVYIDDVTITGCHNSNVAPQGITTTPTLEEEEVDMPARLSNLNVFPNPANDYLNVEYTTTDIATVEVFVMDITGKVVQQRSLREGTDIQSVQLDISQLKSGFYFVQLITGDSNISRKFVKQ